MLLGWELLLLPRVGDMVGERLRSRWAWGRVGAARLDDGDGMLLTKGRTRTLY